MASVGDAEEEGYEDEYQLEAFEISMQDYIKPQAVQNFRNAWEELDESTEMTDDYGLGQRDSLQVKFLAPIVMTTALSVPLILIHVKATAQKQDICCSTQQTTLKRHS